MKTILFACVHNAGRSQMAAAWFNALCDPKAARAISAGTQPADQVHREVTTAMKEAGIDLDRTKVLLGQFPVDLDSLNRAHDLALLALDAHVGVDVVLRRVGRVTAMLAERGLGRK